MTRVGSKISFSEEEKENLKVKEYSEIELRDKEIRFREKQKRRRHILLFILIGLIVLSVMLKELKYLLYIGIVVMCFLIILYEYIDWINIKVCQRAFYIEFFVDEKLDVETYIEQTLTPGSDILSFYPVKGRDSTTGYVSIFYINKEQYDRVKKGETARISVKGDQL